MSLPPWARLVVAVACAKAALGLVLYLSLGEVRATPAVPVWVYAALTAAFATVGGTLVAGNRRDPRAAWLGGLLLLIASALAPVVNSVAGGYPLAAVVRPDAFLPAFIWMLSASSRRPWRPRRVGTFTPSPPLRSSSAGCASPPTSRSSSRQSPPSTTGGRRC